MIYNYLNFAKGKRAHAIWEARRCMGESRDTTDEWMDGFYRGMKLAFEHESHHWRTLQKDIEAHLQKGYEMTWTPDVNRKLADLLNH